MNSQIPHISAEKPPKGVFVAAFVMIFFCTMSVADSVGFVPNYLDNSSPASASDSMLPASSQAATPVRTIALSDLPVLGQEDPSTSPPQTVAPEVALPERIVIPAINLDLAIQNPSTRNIDTLDALLQNGPARHVDSAKLGEAGTMIIFAHSSHLPIVHNKMFQAFNRIPELQPGDMITLQAAGKNYLYSVTSLQKVDISNATIDLSPTLGTRLTLVTCDTLTGKTARYMLEADFVGTYAQ